MAKLKCNLKQILMDQGLSVKRFAELIGRRRMTINDLVQDDISDRRIPALLIAEICSYFKITPNELFEVIEEEN